MAKLNVHNGIIIARFRYIHAADSAGTLNVYAIVREVGKDKKIQVLKGNGGYHRSAQLEARWESARQDSFGIEVSGDRFISPSDLFTEMMRQKGWEKVNI